MLYIEYTSLFYGLNYNLIELTYIICDFLLF